jgi:hypothetical protein
MAAEPFPFATLDELKARWPDFPSGADAHANVLLEDASQFILDTVKSSVDAAAATRRRIVCAVVRRAMSASESDTQGLESFQANTGPYAFSGKPANPHGDFYLTKAEKTALGEGTQKAFGVQVGGAGDVEHLPWCSLNFGALYCSCGADIAGTPIFEGA